MSQLVEDTASSATNVHETSVLHAMAMSDQQTREDTAETSLIASTTSLPENENDGRENNRNDAISSEAEEIYSASNINTNQENNSEQTDTSGNEKCQQISASNDKEINITGEKLNPVDDSPFHEFVCDLLECPICFNHMVPPIVLCESGHNVCFKCRPFVTKCPLCRGPFLRTRNIALEVLARKLGFSSTQEEFHKGCSGIREVCENGQQNIEQVVYTCPLTMYTHCYWQGNYSDIRRHFEEIHESKMLSEGTTATWDIPLLVRDTRVIFALGEIFFYKERLDTVNSKFYMQVFYVGPRENHSHFVYHVTTFSNVGQQQFVVCNTVLPIDDLEHNYTYSYSHCAVLDYSAISSISKHGDIKCTLSLVRSPRE